MLKGAAGESAKSERMDASVWVGETCVSVESMEGGGDVVREVCVPGLRQSRPRWSIIRAFASRDCPERIIQPQPVSLLKPSRSVRFRNRTDQERPVVDSVS